MNWLNPAMWDGIGIVSFLIVFVAAFVTAQFRGWIVLGVHHREIMGQKDREITALEKRSDEDSESIAKFAATAARSTVAAEVQQSIVEAIRQLAQERTP
ncbi:hypothetical protein [Mycobacteroides chelonae]|uniref:hypothetical protein n=1 Tax=Mycobacteroides chelonae TaxID=1774 RepID=UPI0008A976F4|nr:hypothetical protein [Mycobacteroides chelonae]OHU48093.1 hypothetical protein BKG81_11155 [Mycobacteroides chelonae]